MLCFALLIVGGVSCTRPETLSAARTDTAQRPPHSVLDQAVGCDYLAAAAPGAAFVLLDPAASHWTGCNPHGASTAYLPASTFKVPHALIALATGVVEDPDAILAWDRVQRSVASWNRDTSLASGMRNSTIWFYQHTARKIGHARMSQWVRQLDYGNANIGNAENSDTFWLNGALRISAIEQVAFLDRLRRGRLPATADHQRLVRDMMRQVTGAAPERAAATLFAKSGAAIPIVPHSGDLARSSAISEGLGGATPVGWYVGWVTRPAAAGGDRVFAFNLPLQNYGDMAKRTPLAHALLEKNGVKLSR